MHVIIVNSGHQREARRPPAGGWWGDSNAGTLQGSYSRALAPRLGLKGPVQSVEVVYLVHATEDANRIEEAVSWLLGGTAEAETERLEGHFGNEITKARVHLTGEEAARGFEQVIAKMPRRMKTEIVSAIGAHMDEHSALFLRLDKQRLISGSLALAARDTVRVKVKPRGFMVKGGGAQFFSQLIGRS